MTVTVYANNQSSNRILGVELELIKDTVFIASGGELFCTPCFNSIMGRKCSIIISGNVSQFASFLLIL